MKFKDQARLVRSAMSREQSYSTVDKTPSGYRAIVLCKCGWMSVVDAPTFQAAGSGMARAFHDHGYKDRSVCKAAPPPKMPYRGPYEVRVRPPRDAGRRHPLIDSSSPDPLAYDHTTPLTDLDKTGWETLRRLAAIYEPYTTRLRDSLLMYAYYVWHSRDEFAGKAGRYHAAAAIKRYARIREPVWEWLRDWLEPVEERGGVSEWEADGKLGPVGTGIRGVAANDLYFDRIGAAIDGLVERGYLTPGPEFIEDPSSWNYRQTRLTPTGCILAAELPHSTAYGKIRQISGDPAALAWPAIPAPSNP